MKQFKSMIFGGVAAALVLVASPAVASSDEYVTYTVKRTDTLYGIADRYLINRQSALQVQRLNRIRNARRLRINRELRIPRNLLSSQPVLLTVAALSGNVLIDGQAPAIGTVLREGEAVTTGSNGFVSFTTSYGGRVSLPTNTSAVLQSARRYTLGNALDVDFRLRRGRVNTQSPRLNPQDRLQMSTPLAVTAVRGTTFRIGFDPDGGDVSLTEVTEGAVNVAAGDQQRDAPAGFGIASTSAGVMPPEELLPAPAILDPAAVQTGETLDFAVEPTMGATGYRVQLARDAGFLDVLGEQVVDTTAVSLPGLDNGRYFVRARAIAESGLEGQSESYSFLRKRLSVAGTASAAEGFDGYTFGWLPEGGENVSFAFQLWEEGNAEALLVDELGLSVTELALINLEPGRYGWRVAALDTDPQEGLIKVWGAPQTLVVSN